jgi:hypothetical protein
VIDAAWVAHCETGAKGNCMKNQLRGVVGLLVSYLFATACSAVPPAEEVGDDSQPSGGNAGNAGNGSAGTPANGGASNGGTPSVGGAVGNGGGSGTVGSGGSVGTGGVATGGTGAVPPTGGTNAGGAGGTIGNGGTGVGGRGGAAGAPGGRGGTTGSAGKGGSGGGSAGSPPGSCATWPTANGSQNVSSTIQVSGTYDGTMKRFVGTGALGTSGQQEGQGPLFEVANNGTLKNVILGNPAADGVHCAGNCTLENVWWEDVGEDAATFRGTSTSGQMTVRCGGARGATDKVFQHNGAGTLTIQNFTAENFNKLYRSCGNCNAQYARHVILQDVTVRMGQVLVGINTNYGDSADFDRINVYGSVRVCERYTGNNTGAEPVRTGEGADGTYCRYETADIIQR